MGNMSRRREKAMPFPQTNRDKQILEETDLKMIAFSAAEAG